MSRRSLLLPVLFVLAGCGARSELWTPDADCVPLTIGIFGNPGAYDKSQFEGWLRGAGAGVARVQTTSTEALTEDALRPHDVVVLDWLTRDYTASEATTLATWIESGGGVMAMSGYDNVTTDDWHANSLLAPLGVAYSGPLIEGPVTDFAPHPITEGLESVVFKGGYAISELGGDTHVHTPIATLPAGADGSDVNVGYAIESGDGRAFVWGDEWIEFLSEEGSDFPPDLWIQAFAWLAPKDRCRLKPAE